MKKTILTLLFTYLLGNVLAQTSDASFANSQFTMADSAVVNQGRLEGPNLKGRQWVAGALATVGMGGSLLFLYKSNNYEYQREFKTRNDSKVWLQLDKAEHLFLSYSTARYLSGLGNWAGLSANKSVILGSAGSLLYLTTKEFLDGHNVIPGVGWSWIDMGANSLGIALFASQQLAWQEQKIQLKFSGLPQKYEPDLNDRANILFGSSKPERVLKDHNAQTYWLSFNLNAVSSTKKVPGWLNLAIGYGGTNMFGPVDNLGYQDGLIVFDRSDLKRYRQWYISPDIDLTKIKTNNRVVKTLLFTLNSIKVPLPTLEYANQKVKGHWLLF